MTAETLDFLAVQRVQSQREDVGERCTINVWPLAGEIDDARAALL